MLCDIESFLNTELLSFNITMLRSMLNQTKNWNSGMKCLRTTQSNSAKRTILTLGSLRVVTITVLLMLMN